MTEIVNEKAVITATPSVNHSSSGGYFVTIAAGVATLAAAATDVPAGVIVDGVDTDSVDSIARENFSGIVNVKLGGDATAEGYGTLQAGGTVQDDPGSGSRVRVCRFLESGSSGDLVKAILITPVELS